MLRIAAALAVWGTAYALVERVQVHGLSWESVRAALYQVLLGKTCFHLWFLYMLLGLYLVTPVLRAFVRGQAGGISTGFSCWYLFSPSSCPPFCACGPARR